MWEVFAEEGDSGQGFLGWHVTTRCHDDVWFFVFAVGGELPNTSTFGAMGDGVVHIEVLEMILLVSNNDVDIVGAAETVIGDREKAIGVWWKINSNNFGALVGNNVKESRILMGKAIVILS